MRRLYRAVLLVLLACLPAGCVRAPVAPPPSATIPPPAGFPADFYGSEARQLGRVYRIDPAQSQLDITVRRSGRLAHLGHNHIVSSRELRGHVLLGTREADSRFDLWFPVAGLSVDEPALRAAAGAEFATQPSASDVSGTRANMLGEKLLDAAQHPYIVVGGRWQGGSAEAPVLDLHITVRGATHVVPARTQVESAGDTLRASGELLLSHAALGLTPFSVLGGALAVDENLQLRYRITAQAQ